MAHPELVRQKLLVVGRVQKILDILIGDGDTAIHQVALHVADEHLPANLFAKLHVAHPVRGQRRTEFLQSHLVLLSVGHHRPGETFVVDLHPSPRCLLKLQALNDQAFHELADQNVVGRKLHAPRLVLVANELQPTEQLRGQHHVLFHHRHDGVQLLVFGQGHRRAHQASGHDEQPARETMSRSHSCPPVCNP